jgi:probable phosphoglycerate mutase
MKIFLVRHGEAAASWHEADNPGLSERGREQAAATAERLLRQVAADTRLISSPLLRAQETARPLAQSLGTPIAVVEAFREIPAPVPLAERQEWLRTVARQRWSEQHEMVQEWQQSLLQQLQQIREPTVVFTHFMVLNAIVGALTAKDRVVCFLPENASVTTLQWTDDALQLVELGQQRRMIDY